MPRLSDHKFQEIGQINKKYIITISNRGYDSKFIKLSVEFRGNRLIKKWFTLSHSLKVYK